MLAQALCLPTEPRSFDLVFYQKAISSLLSTLLLPPSYFAVLGVRALVPVATLLRPLHGSGAYPLYRTGSLSILSIL